MCHILRTEIGHFAHSDAVSVDLHQYVWLVLTVCVYELSADAISRGLESLTES